MSYTYIGIYTILIYNYVRNYMYIIYIHDKIFHGWAPFYTSGHWGLENTQPLRDIMEKAMAPHSSTLAWKIPWMEEPGRLQSMGSLRVGHDWATSLSLFTFMHWRRKWQPTLVFLPGESQGRGSLVGCQTSMGSHRVRHDWSDLAAAAARDIICKFIDMFPLISFHLDLAVLKYIKVFSNIMH